MATAPRRLYLKLNTSRIATPQFWGVSREDAHDTMVTRVNLSLIRFHRFPQELACMVNSSGSRPHICYFLSHSDLPHDSQIVCKSTIFKFAVPWKPGQYINSDFRTTDSDVVTECAQWIRAGSETHSM